MKAVICSLNSQYVHSSLAPWCLKAGAETFCACPAQVEVVEGTVNQPEEEILNSLLDTQTDILAFCCYIWNIHMVTAVSRKYHDLRPETVLVLGGPEVSFRGRQVLQDMPWISFVNCGEGERPFALLLDALAVGDPAVLENIPGLCRRLPDTRIAESLPYYTTEEPPTPYTKEYLQSLNGRMAYLETSRGCPFSCAFCLSGRCDPVRFFNLDRAKRDMLLLANSGAKTVKLVDRTFNCGRERAYKLWEFLIVHAGREIPDGVCFHFEVAADLFDDRTLNLLSRAPAGLIQMEAGLQSFHGPTLEAVNRKTDLDRLCRNLQKLLLPGNIHVHIDLIAGLPYEDLATFQNSFDKAYALRPHMLQLGFLKLLYGSRLRDQADEYGTVFSQQPPYTFISGRWLAEKEVHYLHALEDVLERMYNSGRFRRTLGYLQRVTQLTPFQIMGRLGECLGEPEDTAGLSLEKYTACLQKACESLPGVDPAVLRDVMALDILSTNRSGRLPVCLQRQDPRLKGINRRLAQASILGEKGVKRGAVILYSQGERVMAAEYTRADPITGQYAVVELRDGRLIPLPDGDLPF